MRARTRARGWALQVLYAWESRGAQGDPGAVLDDFLEDRNIAAESQPYLRRLVEAVGVHRPQVEDSLREALTNWRLEMLSVIDRNVLRIGATEMLHMEGIPERVAIQEAIILAEKYGTHESPRFVNGVLDALMQSRESAEGALREESR